MTPVALLLAVAVAAGPSGQPKRTGLAMSNAVRARAGLLPRKPARAQSEAHGRFATVRTPAPTYLGDPAPVADPDATPVMDGDADASPDVATADGDASTPAAPELVAARGPVEVRRLRDAAASDEADAPPHPVTPVSAPDEVGAMRAEAVGVATDVTISLRFDP